MKRLALLLPLLALASGCSVPGRGWLPEIRPLDIRLSSQANADGPEFTVEAWVLELSKKDAETLDLEWILTDSYELVDSPLPASDRTPESSRRRILCFSGPRPTVPVRGGTDGFQPATSVFTEPERALVFQAVSNHCAAVFRHTPPFTVRSSDRMDAFVPGCVFSASAVPSGDWNRFDLYLAVDMSTENSNDPMPLPRVEPIMSVYPRCSACVSVPSLEKHGTFRLFVLKPSGPASAAATNATAATPAGKAERIRHAIEQLEYEVRGLDEELAKTDTARTAEETAAIKTRRDAIARRIDQERRFLAGEGPDPAAQSPAEESHAESAEDAEN